MDEVNLHFIQDVIKVSITAIPLWKCKQNSSPKSMYAKFEVLILYIFCVELL